MSLTAIHPESSALDAPSGLITPANPDSGQQTQFTLFSDSWIELQGYVGAAMELPAARGSFEDKYGPAGLSPTVTDCIGAMQGVQSASAEFGHPRSLRRALLATPDLLDNRDAPSEIYTHTVWLGQRVYQTAGKLITGYDSMLQGLGRLPARAQVQTLKAYLFDQELGPISLSRSMSDDVGVLIRKVVRFEQKMNDYNDKLRSFTGGASKMMTDLNLNLGRLAQKIADLEQSRDDAYQAWRDFTIAAATTSVGCMLVGGMLAPLTGGVSLLVGGPATIAIGVGLGAKAAQCRTRYNEYCDQIGSKSAELQKKQRLRSDLGDFDTQMRRVGPALSQFLKNLRTIEGAWLRMHSEMLSLNICMTETNVGAMPFLFRAKSNPAVESWKAVGDSARQFTAESLVDYTSLAFGDSMPDTLPLHRAA